MVRYAVMIALASVPSVAHAAAERSAGLSISLEIPEICHIEAPELVVDANRNSATGSVFEICNSGRGFRVLASHRNLADGENVEVTYGGEKRQLNASGVSDVATRQGPTLEQVPLEIKTEGLAQPLVVSFGLAVI